MMKGGLDQMTDVSAICLVVLLSDLQNTTLAVSLIGIITDPKHVFLGAVTQPTCSL